MFSQMADDHGFWQNAELESFGFEVDAAAAAGGGGQGQEPLVETISPVLTVSIPPFGKSDFDDALVMGGSICGSSYSLDVSDTLSSNSVLSSADSSTFLSRQLELEREGWWSQEESGAAALESAPATRYRRLPRQGRYAQSPAVSPPAVSPAEISLRAAGPSSASPCAAEGEGKKVSDSRLSAQGLAKVLKLDSPEEALKRERYILDIFENELHYPLGYKTWVRDTFKDYRVKLIDQLHERVKHRYPEYDHSVLETIIRRATYYMMQSRLRRERRARAKGLKMARSSGSSPS